MTSVSGRLPSYIKQHFVSTLPVGKSELMRLSSRHIFLLLYFSSRMMTASDECENVNHVSAEALRGKIEHVPYTWAEIREKIIWKNVLYFLFFHTVSIASLIFYAFGYNSVPLKWQTVVWVFAYGYGTGLGVTAGAHRLWSHRTYKANLLLRIILMLAYSVLGLNPLFHWVKDHRVHHKFVDTDSDPHNATRGFFFSHIGWQMMKRHPDYIREAKKIDMADILADPVVMFNKKYATPLKVLCCFVIPAAIPIVFWGESIVHAILTSLIRYVILLHCICTTASVSHLWGYKPYDRRIRPVDNLLVDLISGGEGSHNYHHTFPWDYKSTEFAYCNFNFTTRFIDLMAKLGWARDRRVASQALVEKVIRRIVYNSGHEADGAH